MRGLCSKVLSAVMSVALVVGLCPGLAYAGDTAGGLPLAPAGANVVAQDDKVDIGQTNWEINGQSAGDLAYSRYQVAYGEPPFRSMEVSYTTYNSSTGEDETEVLEEGKDYEVVYFRGSYLGDEIPAGVKPALGTYSVGIKGVGGFTGFKFFSVRPPWI